jgi:hypothetical protein
VTDPRFDAPTPLLAWCIPHEQARFAVAYLAPWIMTFAIFCIAAIFGEVGGYRGDSEFWPALAIAVLFFGQIPVWTFNVRTFPPVGGLLSCAEIVAAVIAVLFAYLMFSRDRL